MFRVAQTTKQCPEVGHSIVFIHALPFTLGVFPLLSTSYKTVHTLGARSSVISSMPISFFLSTPKLQPALAFITLTVFLTQSF